MNNERGVTFTPDEVGKWLDTRAETEAEDVPAWIDVALRTRGDSSPTCLSLAGLLADDEEAPPALRRIATAYLETRFVNGRPRSRDTDPATSKAAAEASRSTTARPGGTVHRILRAFASVERDGVPMFDDAGERGIVHAITAREVEDAFSIRAAHKRTSELLRDGLLTVVRSSVLDDAGVSSEVDVTRDGSRVLAITRAGLDELARLDLAAGVESTS
jgi:hypothetical protein